MILQTREEMGRGGTDSEHTSQRFGTKRSNNLEAVFLTQSTWQHNLQRT